jgi:hypothetical protein
MIVELKALQSLSIADLGIILSPGDSIDLLENFEADDLINSEDLETSITSSQSEVYVDTELVDYNEFIRRIRFLTEHKHYNLNQIQHNLYSQSYFIVTKQSGKSKFITYYTDSTMAEKIEEDEIVRDGSGRVNSIIKRKFKNNTETQKQTQLLNRGATGKVDSISTNIT